MAVVLFEEVELFSTAVDVSTGVGPGVCWVVFLDVGVGIA